MPASREPAVTDGAAQQAACAAFQLSQTAQLLLLDFLIAAGAYLRLSHLGSRSLWLDEAITLQLARMPWQQFAASWWHGDAAYQSLYYLAMRCWSPGPYSEFWIRLPSAIFGVAAIPMLYLVSRKLTSSITALAAAALLTFSVTDVYYSQEARSYTLAIFLVLLSYYFFLQAVETDSRRFWLLWSISSILAVYVHDFTALVVVAQISSLVFGGRPLPWGRLLSYGLLIALGTSPALSFVFRVPAKHLQYSWMPKASPRELYELLLFLGGAHLRFLLIAVLWVSGTIAIFGSRRDKREFWRGMLVVLWFLLPIAIMAVVSMLHPVFVQRYMIFSLPGALILAAMGTVPLRKWHLGLVVVAILCVSSVIAAVKQYREPRDDWRGATQAILSAAEPEDALLFVPDYLALPFSYYRERNSKPAPTLYVFSTQYPVRPDDSFPDSGIPLGFDPRNIRHMWVVLSGDDQNVDALVRRDPALAAELQRRCDSPEILHFKNITAFRFTVRHANHYHADHYSGDEFFPPGTGKKR